MELFKLYLAEPVPLYIRLPAPRVVRRDLARLREKYYCFVSESFARRSRVATIHYEDEEEPPHAYRVKSVDIVVMARARSPDSVRRAIEVLRAARVRVNPYSSERCVGFYVHTYDELDRVLRLIADYIESAAIVNTVWFIYYDALVNLRRLISAGFTPLLRFNAVIGNINNTTVRVFSNGTVTVYGVHTPESIHRFARQLWAFMRRAGAVR